MNLQKFLTILLLLFLPIPLLQFRDTQEAIIDFSYNIYTMEESDSWTKRWSIFGIDWASGVAIDSFNNIYVLGGTTTTNERRYFLAKVDNLGTLVWQYLIDYDDSFYFYLYTIQIDEYNDIYLAGNLKLKGEREEYLILLKYDNTGTQLWNKTWGGYEWFKSNDMDIDSQGNIYIAGSVEINQSNYIDMYLVKLNNSGTILWNHTRGTEGMDEYHAIASTIDNNVYVAGEYNDTAMLIKYNSSGYYNWNYTWNIFSIQHDLTVDSDGNVLIAQAGSYLRKLNSTGHLLWNYILPEYSSPRTLLITDSHNDIYIAENRYMECHDNSFFLQSECICTAIYLEKINSSGTFLWEKCCTGCADASCSDIEMDSSGNLYITGELRGEFGCTKQVHDAILMKNPKGFEGKCIEIYYDLLFVILTPIILASLIFLNRIIKRHK